MGSTCGEMIALLKTANSSKTGTDSFQNCCYNKITVGRKVGWIIELQQRY
jgi:hypothetical protein